MPTAKPNATASSPETTLLAVSKWASAGLFLNSQSRAVDMAGTKRVKVNQATQAQQHDRHQHGVGHAPFVLGLA